MVQHSMIQQYGGAGPDYQCHRSVPSLPWSSNSENSDCKSCCCCCLKSPDNPRTDMRSGLPDQLGDKCVNAGTQDRMTGNSSGGSHVPDFHFISKENLNEFPQTVVRETRGTRRNICQHTKPGSSPGST